MVKKLLYLATVKRYDTYAMNLTSIWAKFNGELLPEKEGKIILAGCGAFAPYRPVSDVTCYLGRDCKGPAPRST